MSGFFIWPRLQFIWFQSNFKPKANVSSRENVIKSSNVNRLQNVLHIHSNNHDWVAFFIQVLSRVKDIHVENKLEWRNLTIFFHFQKWVFVLRKIVINDAGKNQNVNMLTVSGTLLNAYEFFGDFVLRGTAYKLYHIIMI